MSRIVSADRLNDHYIAYEIEAPEIASRIEPGQLLEVGLGQAVVVPHAIAEFSRDKGTVTVVAKHGGVPPVAAEPPFTQIDLRGPFGQHSVFRGVSKILCVAEGLGVAALFPRLQELKARDIYAVVVVGFHSKDYVYWVDRLDSISNELYVVTDDGSYGIRGPMGHTIKGGCEYEIDIARARALGSLQLLRTCCRITNAHGIPTLISLNAVLVEDTELSAPEGAAEVAYDWSTASDLDGHKVDFDELVKELGISAAR
jgi:ferredoxin--NADP+ reductase